VCPRRRALVHSVRMRFVGYMSCLLFSATAVLTLRALQISKLSLLLFLNPRKNEGGKKLRKVQRGLKWKTSPGGPQKENRRAAIRR